MNMESPVRICLGAALVLTTLLLCSTSTTGLVLPESPAIIAPNRSTRFTRTNTTFVTRRPKTLDVALNELHPKDSVSEEHTEKNAKYKDRGRVRFNAKPTETTYRPRVRTSTTTAATPVKETSKLIIVTPTPEVKKPLQIIDGMKAFKKTKMPISSSTTPMPKSVKDEEEHSETEYDERENEEEDKSYEKYTSGQFGSDFFTNPSYNDHHHYGDSSSKTKTDYTSSPYSAFSSFFPEVSYDPNHHDEPYKVDSFFDFESELTTPRNDFFDKKYQAVSSSIIKNLGSVSAKQPPTKSPAKLYKLVNKGSYPSNNSSPEKKSTVIIQNTKEIRLLDNDEAGSEHKKLSDVHGTSIYYEVSVLSTETYNLNSGDDDCDNDTQPDPTVGTSAEEELTSTRSTVKDLKSDKSEVISLSTDFTPFDTATPSSISVSTQNIVSSTEKAKRVNYLNFSRNRKRLGGPGANDPNNLTPKESTTSYSVNRGQNRKFHHATPKVKPVWMAPRRNITRTFPRTTIPTTIYSEHFSVKDKNPATTPKTQPSRASLTTVTSEIDPVLQSDVSGVKKIVHSQTISDNSIPTLWKRGSTKFGSSSTSTATSAETDSESGVSDMEIPPTLTAWALASLRSTPGQASTTNATAAAPQKSIDENELQKVGEVTSKKETTTTSTTTTTTATINNAIISEKYTEVEQDRLPWRPAQPIAPPSTESEASVDTVETKTERLPAESNISVQNSVESGNNEENSEIGESTPKPEKQWVQVTSDMDMKTSTKETEETIPPVDASKSTGFESITKLPADLTTPQYENIISGGGSFEDEEVPSTTDYEITTIRFSYVPTQNTAQQDKVTTSNWHQVFPTRTKTTTVKDDPITTYRPKFITSTESDESTTMMHEMTPTLEVSSQISERTSENPATETTVTTKEPVSTEQTSLKVQPMTTSPSVETPTTTEHQETTTIIVEVSTEINTEREKPQPSTEVSRSTESSEATETSPSDKRDSSSEENSGSNEVITQETTKMIPSSTTEAPKETTVTTECSETTETTVTTTEKTTTAQSEKLPETSTVKEEETTLESTTEVTTKAGNDSEETSFSGAEVTTEAVSRVIDEGSGAAVAIAVSTIGVIALILLVGLLLVVRRRGRRGVYAQRCTPVSLDAYSLDSVSVGARKGNPRNQRLRTSKRSYGNPAYDDEVTSHPMQYAALANFALDVESMSAEFAEIPSVSVRPDEVPPGCEDKNRYSNVLPLPDTRVPLKKIENDPTSEYINANFITGPGNIKNYYVACQAPLANTVVDFWRMIWEQNSRVIVMLTEYMENGVEKCYEYLPPSEVSDNKRTFGDYQIILVKREQRDKYAISSVQVINLATRTWREITHLWYFWPAKGVPDDYDSVLEFLSEMRSYMKIAQTAKEYDEEGVEVIYGDQSRSSFHNLTKLRAEEGSGNGVNVYSPSKAEENMRRHGTNGTLGRMKAASEVEGVRPCVVVCASGAGRSAALIAADICARALAAGTADVPRVVRELRAQRPHSLANRHHYIFLYKVLSEYGNKLMGGGVDTI